jgi:uncharacterized lipoprotein YmbA
MSHRHAGRASAASRQRRVRATRPLAATGHWAALGAALGAVLALAGCASSPPSHFYTLTGSAAASSTPAAPAARGTPLFIEVPPASLPAQLQRPQLVLNSGPGQVDIRELRRWSQPLGDEIGQAVSEDVTRALPALDVYGAARPQGQTVYRIALNVQRFDSVLGQRAAIDTIWSITRVPPPAPLGMQAAGLTLTCHSAASVPLAAQDDGFEALVAGHRQALGAVAQQIEAGLASMARLPGNSTAAALPACPA